MGPKKTVTVQDAIARNLAPFLEMKLNADGIPTALEPDAIVAFLHEMEQYNAQRTDVMEQALILPCMSGDVRAYLGQYENLLLVSYTDSEDEQEIECELLSYDRWDPNKKAERQKCLDWDERIADALRKEFGLSRHGTESFNEMLDAIAAEELITSRGTAQGLSRNCRLDRRPCSHRRQELWRRHQHPQCRLSREAVRWIPACCRLSLVERWSLSHVACPGSEQQ